MAKKVIVRRKKVTAKPRTGKTKRVTARPRVRKVRVKKR